jgi:hypothetical protein
VRFVMISPDSRQHVAGGRRKIHLSLCPDFLSQL